MFICLLQLHNCAGHSHEALQVCRCSDQNRGLVWKWVWSEQGCWNKGGSRKVFYGVTCKSQTYVTCSLPCIRHYVVVGQLATHANGCSLHWRISTRSLLLSLHLWPPNATKQMKNSQLTIHKVIIISWSNLSSFHSFLICGQLKRQWVVKIQVDIGPYSR